ncbi:Alpha/Beta hydrolase protein [Hysterangium stoloniferum]|nr:Alpha/Beta hydrolase protein [Hysterangium stoloniferum]
MSGAHIDAHTPLTPSATGPSLDEFRPPISSCDLTSVYKAGYAIDSAYWVSNISINPFYKTPLDISDYVPGDLIRLVALDEEALKRHAIPPGLSSYRFLYQSSDLDGEPVLASAFILLPYGRSKQSEPLKVLMWAHGTSGIERQCAPSNQRNLYYGYEAPFAMALRGYAVIGPDYAGQGSDTTFHYLSGPSHAADVVNALLAARQAFPSGFFTREWIVIGHSEGGLTAWSTNEREMAKPTGGFLGSVAIAPALQNLQIIRYGVAHDALGLSLFYSPYTLATIARLNKSIDITKYFSRTGLERMRLAETACIFTASAVFSDMKFSDIFDDESWIDSSWALEWENRTAIVGDKPLAQPLLLIEGMGDRSVFPAVPEAVFAEHCENQPNTKVHLSRYPELDHDDVAFASQMEYFNWIADRFNGVVIPEGCTNATVDVITHEHTPNDPSEHTLVVQT